MLSRRHIGVLAVLAAQTLSCGEQEAPALSGESAPSAPEEPPASAQPSASAEANEPLPQPGTPVVRLDGVTTLAAPPTSAERVGATRWLTRVYRTPARDAKVVGYLRVGAVLAAQSERHGRSKGCTAGWRKIVPTGWVCLDEATEQLDDPILAATRKRPDFAHRLPYMYGTVTRGGPVYDRVPTAEDLARFEPSLESHLDKWRKDRVSGASYGLDVWLRDVRGRTVPSALEALEAKTTDDDMPDFLKSFKRLPVVSKVVRQAADDAVKVDQVNRRQGRSFTHSFLFEGRRYNVTPDLTVIPADRFRPIRGSGFHGWKVDDELELPFALIRRPKAWRYTWDGKKMVKAERAEWRSAHELTGKQKFYRKRLHYETKDGFWLSARFASRIDPAKRWPKWAKQGSKWMDVNITKQVLVAYEGKKMVYATIVSTGEAGLDDPEESTATKRGIFRVHTKWVTTTMDSDVVGEEFELRDVPYVQYFEGGYALHGAYWHDGFGRPKSHGCINLAPEDARRLFFWTDPPVPEGWHGAREALEGTIVFVHP